MENIVTESARYAVQKQPDGPEIFTVGELRKYFGILILMSVYHYPSTRSYWSNKFGFSPIKEAMAVNKFEKMRKLLDFNNNDDDHLPVDHAQHDRLHELRPIITHLNEKFSSVTIEQRLSIDEQMCATKVGHFLKQYLPNKPHKWGFKLFVLCNLSGFAYRFIIYSGKEANEGSSNNQNLGVVGQTVMNLLSVVPRHYLKKRTGKTCKLPTKQDVMKSSIPRGSYEEYVTNFKGIDMTTDSTEEQKVVHENLLSLPGIDDRLDRLSGKVYFTSLDLKSGYYQIPMSEEFKHLTAFVTPDSHYEYTRITHDKILGKDRYDLAIPYMDDLLSPATTIDEGLSKLRKILISLRNANLTLNITKCYFYKFYKRKLDYLGFLDTRYQAIDCDQETNRPKL
ncbi:unnamed protein product [Euphydryas editha]|uniref:PiggyBac transposable element-derived protein domain-containing protein n=1 Tax=Euphydryas editha TaxID=104508 RepID=A0AAU9UFP8_EUPED|nr:unnamed protein product [Euphydryas editha]